MTPQQLTQHNDATSHLTAFLGDVWNAVKAGLAVVRDVILVAGRAVYSKIKVLIGGVEYILQTVVKGVSDSRETLYFLDFFGSV